MATNQYFNKFSNKAEQNLVEDLVVESIKIHGVDCGYIPRSLVNVDNIFGEDRQAKFENGREIEMYVNSYDGFEGEGEVMTQYGLEIRDEITLTISRRRFLDTFSDKGYPYPREGDLIYFPLSNGLFEVNFVEREKNFFNFGKIFTFEMKCSMFKYSGEDMDTGFDVVDGSTADVYTQLFEIVMGSTGSGEFIEGENAHLLSSSAVTGGTMSLVLWDTTSNVVEGSLLSGTIDAAASIVGVSSGASYAITSIGLTQDFFVKDPMENNTDFQLEGSSFIDFTDTDPFSEGDL